LLPIETERLLLRLPVADDADPFVGIHQDPEVIALKHVTLTSPPGGIELGARNVDRMLRHWDRRGYGQFAVVERATARVIGCVGYLQLENSPDIELGWIVHRSRWGNGFATEAARAAIEWAWRGSTIEYIVSLIGRDNPASIRVATKIGQRFEGEGICPSSGENVLVYGIRRPFTVPPPPQKTATPTTS
jgi:RimJ/RimL family protein N-acetyltransferase